MIEIALHQLQFYAFHGCLPQERVVGGDYTVDVRLILPDATTAIEEDDLNGTVNYASVYEVVRKEMEQTSLSTFAAASTAACSTLFRSLAPSP